MTIDSERLKSFLLESSFVSSADILEAEEKARKRNMELGDVLVEDGKISRDDLIHVLGYILGMPFVNLSQEKIDPQILQIIPEPIARRHNIVAYRKINGALEVAMLDPQDLEAIEFIKKKTKLKILARLTDLTSIKYALLQYQRGLQAELREFIGKEAEAAVIQVSSEGKQETTIENLKKQAEEISVVKVVDTLLKHAVLGHASDIHVEPMENQVLVRYRIDGILRDAMILPKQLAPSVIARIKVLSNLRLDEHRLPQDGRFTIETLEERVSFRVSILPVYDGEKAVLRVLVENAKGFTLETLGFWSDNLERIHQAIRKPVGMILATGPTGCGKTTTLYTILDILNTPDINISTIEDPIEYHIPRVNQTQVKPEIGYTFATGLRSLVRQDPDIVMVGEIRDNETAGLAINAALTGHLVLSTLHTNSSAGAIPRLIDMKAEPFLIASTLNAIIAQRLVRTLCRSKISYKLTKQQIKEISESVNLERILDILKKELVIKSGETLGDAVFYKPEPSKECPDGYKGRIGIHEVLEITESIRRLIIGRATAEEIEKQAKKEGMLTMFEEGLIKAVKGITSLEEILRVTKIE